MFGLPIRPWWVDAAAEELDKTSQPLRERGIPGGQDPSNVGLMNLFSLPVLADMLAPVGTYEDGSVGLAWPKLAAGIGDAATRGYEQSQTGLPAINDDDAWAEKSRDFFDAASLAPMAGLGVGVAGGMVDNAVGSAGGKLSQPQGIRAYHWSKEPDAVQDGGRFHQGTHFGTAQQANDRFALEGRGQGGATFPVDLRMSNPMEISDTASGAMGPAYEAAQKFGLSPDDAQSLFSRVFQEGYGPLDELLSQHGFDGLKYTNAVEGPGQTSYIATRPGTVYSATTGDLLYSNAPSGSSVPLALNALERVGADLPMDLASRMARAKEMGFDVDNPVYHGTQYQNIDAFDLGLANEGWRGSAVHTSTDPKMAAFYGNDGRDYPGMIYPLLTRAKNFADYNETRIPPDALSPEQLAKVRNEWGHVIDEDGLRVAYVMDAIGGNNTNALLKSLGYEGLQEGAHKAVFDPKNLRSTVAAFDPAKSDSANLLAANPYTAAAIPAGMEASDTDPFDWYPFIRPLP